MRKLFLFLVVLMVVIYARRVNATVYVSVDFEDGQIHNQDPPGYPNIVPPVVLTESGNHFLRLTASPQDCGPAFATTCPRTRSNVSMGHAATAKSGLTVTYAWQMRIPRATNPNGQNNLLFQLAQDTTAGFTWIGGKTAWIGSLNGRLFLRNDQTQTSRDLGPIPYDQWVSYSLAVFLTDNPALGRIDLTMNGAAVASIVGEATVIPAGVFGNTKSGADEWTQMHLQLVDFIGVFGTVDYDNVQISSVGALGSITLKSVG